LKASFIVVMKRRKILALGRRHAGENLDEFLKKRSAGLETPIQMADALAANWILLANSRNEPFGF
jgi:hypothetical protein